MDVPGHRVDVGSDARDNPSGGDEISWSTNLWRIWDALKSEFRCDTCACGKCTAGERRRPDEQCRKEELESRVGFRTAAEGPLSTLNEDHVLLEGATVDGRETDVRFAVVIERDANGKREIDETIGGDIVAGFREVVDRIRRHEGEKRWHPE